MERSKLVCCFFLFTLATYFVGGNLGYATGVDPSDTTTAANQQSKYEEPVFDSPRQQRRHQETLNRLETMDASNGDPTGPDDWFVVGGRVGDTVNFDVFQGTRDVARRIVEFRTAYGNNCQWRVFDRTSDEAAARVMLADVKSRFENWRREQEQLAEVYRRSTLGFARSFLRSSS